jgi:hypothetical protein
MDSQNVINANSNDKFSIILSTVYYKVTVNNGFFVLEYFCI